MKKTGQLGLIIMIAGILSFGTTALIEYFLHTLTMKSFLDYGIFAFVITMLLFNVLFSHVFLQGKGQEILFFLSGSLLLSDLISFVLYAVFESNFRFSHMDWAKFFDNVVHFDLSYYGIVLIMLFVIVSLYAVFIDRRIFNFSGSGFFSGKGSVKQITANLENSRWLNEKEKKQYFKSYKYSELSNVTKDGIPVWAKINAKGNDMEVGFNSPCHSIIIGSTGSGKTTTFVSPMIQLLAATAAGSSMIVTDPKGELFNLHSAFLQSRGYDVKVIDLRDTYSSYRWNPLDGIWDTYQRMLKVTEGVYARTDNAEKSTLKLTAPAKEYVEQWFEYNGRAYPDYRSVVDAVNMEKKKIFDEVYEDLNDLVSVLIPVQNEKDPMWEKGARSIVLAVLLAMLEDSENPALGMTKEKYNFFNMTKILQNSTNDYFELRNYFAGRSVLSKAFALSKQVCDAAETTRASYMSVLYEKLTMFNDAGICALTSASDFSPERLADHPTALFLKIPDEKDTRHNLAAIFILNIYKTLIKIASATEDLTLPRNVYFIMDEFGNMPKIDKFDKFITVGRSRKIWFTMIIQSYAQLNNVYGEAVADIVKGNCGIKMFIGSNDMGTCKEYSELCGNITVVSTSTSKSGKKDFSISESAQVRPLIYPSDLQRLNHPGDIGHSIIVTFGNYPLMTYFSPSFKVPLYRIGKMDTSENNERFFNEKEVFYDIAKRNEYTKNEIRKRKELKDGSEKEAESGNPAETAQISENSEKTEPAPEKPENEMKDTEENERKEAPAETAPTDEQMAEYIRLWRTAHPDGSIEELFGSDKADQE
ncbi:MAG: type IV secretory system conjugative DNA transfer family protein [Clostridia bacterium]|nr:type IV secretory system conjugative DNA transfer family protein [Clostridia bacterium]